MRRDHARLFVDGSLHYLVVDDSARVLAFVRVLGNQHAVVAFDAGDTLRILELGSERSLYGNAYPGNETAAGMLTLASQTAQVWIRR